MRKHFILDTNVLLHDPNAVRQFADNEVVIPLKVLEEIDRFKRELTELGRNARQVARTLDDLRQQGRLCEGVDLEGGGTVRVAIPEGHDPFSEHLSADDCILKTAVDLQQKFTDRPCVVISKDINLRLKADALGLNAKDYENGHVDTSEFYAGYVAVSMSGEALNTFEEEGRIERPADTELFPNQYLIMTATDDEGRVLLGRYDAPAERIVKLIAPAPQMTPIHPRNTEQRFAVDALMNDEIKLVTLTGKAGTGKTLLAVALGVHKTIDERTYKKLLVSRPTFPMGKDLGYLPGDIEEKLNPWMQPIQDALDLVKHGRNGGKNKDLSVATDHIDIEPLTYIRGRSIPNQFIIIDESQNLTPLEVKTVITRVGHGTKIVLTGDIYQIDNPYVDILSNGLNAVAERFRNHDIAAHVMLKAGVRSKVAELAANVL